ncbi:dTDP-4-dehydrorhamnose reductase [Sphingobacterium spiritivorum]|uniref:dTDP-4-dehydrorhamnose reductase n=1 Tax=Sphingobacterium spiritivorum ATCC 33861 TaxID=525373 RepID=D7VI86_SPHSI|nr:dTDP-4-dehydrorhamnose reductase [Sphingobacterium spiritivorum]EFK59788.1 dTDP-4-dehydrorhamnose reductase [Sphingobacterium spiritivorum ATCC 33861]QQT37567.1 dTDP-4-dehydrorhamnose reductase [Sphingobacterium spiritivorum]WQD34364.1 dTDP-4-dehydrorhamnose reductase [Sphingobacterium spiritivorum]SUI97293.1 dTDP-4-dehydrorhamnose reductase [Sphingobacterium spiritivorum]
MKILITGANGQLGSELREIYNERQDVETFFLDRKQLPLEQTMLIQNILAMYEPDLIIHAAAYTAVDLAESEPELADAINHLASEQIAEYCAIHGTRLIAISTDYVFDGKSAVALSEDSSVGPISVYGKTKLKGEQIIQRLCPDAIIIRTSWVYSVYGKNFVKTMIRLMTEREEIGVVSDQIGSPTAAKDLASAIVHIIDAAKWEGGIYHYSNDGEISWYDFALAIKDFNRLSCNIRAISTNNYPTPAQRPQFSLLDKSKIKRIFGVNVPYWKDSLRQTLMQLNEIR